MAEAAVSQSDVYSARPTVRVDGQEQRKITELVIGMHMSEHESGLSSLALRLSNVASETTGDADLAFEDESLIRLGSGIAVYGGDEVSPQEIFSGTVTGLEAEFPADGPPEIVVLAEDSLQAARMSRRTAVHEDLSIGDLARNVAAELNLQPAVAGFSDGVGTWIQLNESDLAFLRRLLRRYDGDLQIVGNELQVSPRSEVQRGSIELELYSQLRGARFIADLADQVTEVTASGWDAAAGRRVTATSSGVDSGPGSGRSGADILRDAIGARSEHLGHLAVTLDAEAQALANAAFDQRARRFVCLEGTTEGNPALRVGTHVTIRGVSSRFDNTYYIVSACHRFDMQRGYETDIKAECSRLEAA